MGLNFLFFLLFLFFYHCCFECFFITVPLKKMHVSTICTPAPPRPNCKKNHGKTKIRLMTYIMTNILINIMINVMTYLFMNIMTNIMIDLMINKMIK